MTKYIDTAVAAKMIKAALKAKFPGVKFGVTSSRYSGGSSITVKYEDGPTRKEVEAVTGPYQGAGFDGMIDMQYYKSAILLKDGTVAYGSSSGTVASRGSDSGYDNPVPEGAERVRFGCDWVHVIRNYSDEFVKARVDEYKAGYADGKQVHYVPGSQQKWGWAGASIKVEPWDSNVQHHISRYVEDYNGLNRSA